MLLFKSSSDRHSAFATTVLAVIAGVCVWLVFQGYGSDDDTYGMLRTWQILILEHRYEPSRFQGSIVAELLLGETASLGGAILSNATILSCAVVGLAAINGIMSAFGISRSSRLLAIAVIAGNGVFIVASTSSMDYLPAFALFAAGLYLLIREEDVIGVVLMGASAGARITYSAAAVVAILIVLEWRRSTRRQGYSFIRAVLYPITAFGIAGLFYLTVWLSHGLELSWLSSARPLQQGLAGLIGRFLYKSLEFLSISGALGFAIGLWLSLRKPADAPMTIKSDRWWLLVLGGALTIFHLALFLYLPAELAYLLPALVFGAVGLAALGFRSAMLGLIVGELAADVVILEPLKVQRQYGSICGPTSKLDIQLFPHLEDGFIISDVKQRRDMACSLRLLKIQPATLGGRLPPTR